ncbi:ABC transporter permease subunit [Brevibacillus nitrificans]|uniref:ABC transporter permease n=1 Tax=Brevibacillus nitrificans TaxID=651560 RepID=UPI00285D2127|nr:ABC transporter permease subunit [Brevibacillus nitrificans]MDR7318260.1 putative spermidine/putrescine transport system permease protein [Brevibacillus nitrificans]
MSQMITRMSLKVIGYAAALLIIVGPLSSLVLWSFAEKWYWPHLFPQDFGLFYWKKVLDGTMLDSLSLSFGIASLVTLLTLLLTIPLSYMLARFHIPARAIILIIFLLPQAFPQLPVFSNALVLMYKWDLAGTVTGVVLIHLVGALVFAVWTLVSVFNSIPVSLEEAAVDVGASRVRVFFTVTLPLALPGIIAASLLVFLYSLDEFTGSLLIGSPFVITMPIYMYNSAMGYEMQVSSITALLLMLPGVILLFLLERFLKSEYLSAFGRG